MAASYYLCVCLLDPDSHQDRDDLGRIAYQADRTLKRSRNAG